MTVDTLGMAVDIPEKLQQVRQNRALQLQSTPERLDLLYYTTLLGPNMAYVDTYWRNAKESVQDVQRSVLEDQKQKRKAAMLKRIYVTMAEPTIDDQHLEVYGEMAGILKPEVDETQYGEEFLTPDLLLGQAEVVRRAGDYAKAIEMYQRVLEQDANNTRALNNLAWVYADKLNQNLENALKWAQEAVQIAKDRGQSLSIPTYLDTLATVQIRLAEKETNPAQRGKLLDEAEQHLNEADRATARLPQNAASVAKHREEIRQIRAQVTTMTGYVWYVGYGSNLSEQRFLCYIQGGTPPFGKDSNRGCQDQTRPKAEKPIKIHYPLYFALPEGKTETSLPDTFSALRHID